MHEEDIDDENKISRRKVITGLGATLALAAMNPVFSFAQKAHSEETGTEGLVDPTTKYPRPPFESQSQPWPGLASKCIPAPTMARRATKALAGLKGARH